MLFITFIDAGRRKLGVLDHTRREVIDLSRAAPHLPHDMLTFLALGEPARAEVHELMIIGEAHVPLSQVQLAAPIPRPARNIFCVGKNYRDHVQELQRPGSTIASKDAMPEVPIFFTKAPSTVIGPKEPIPAWLDPTESTDYEGELAVVIGTGGRGIPRAEAMRHVFGYTIINDVTARILQGRHQQWFLGKSLDGFCPMGPAIMTADEVPEVGTLRVQTRVNGELRQDAPVSSLIFDIPVLIETLP